MSQKSTIKRPSFFNISTLWMLIFLASFLWSLQVAGVFQQELVNFGGIVLVGRFLKAALSPELRLEFLQLTLEATLKTLSFAVCGTVFSLLIGLVFGLFSSEIWWHSVNPTGSRNLGKIIRTFLAIPRSIHEVIWGLFFVNIFGLDALVGILAIALPFGTITAKVFSEILDETPRLAFNSLLNSGVSPLKSFLYTLFPQAFLNLLSYSFYRFECSIRSAAVLGIIGAGGLGYQILLSLQSLRYEQMWTLLIALVILTGSTDIWSSTLRHRLGLPSRLDINSRILKKSHQTVAIAINPKLYFPSFVQLSSWVIIGLILFSFYYVNADFSKLWSPRTAELLCDILQAVFPPDFSQLNQLIILSQKTLALSILAITFAGLGGILLSFPASNNLGLSPQLLTQNFNSFLVRKFLLILTRFVLLFARAVPEPIWALIFLFVLFPGILPGAIALGLHNLGILGRLMAEVTENLDGRPLRSLSALGATSSQVFLYGVLPLTIPRFLAYIFYRWEVCIRSTVIVGLVGAGGLGRLLTEQLSSFDYHRTFATLIVLISLTLMVDCVSHSARQSLRL